MGSGHEVVEHAVGALTHGGHGAPLDAASGVAGHPHAAGHSAEGHRSLLVDAGQGNEGDSNLMERIRCGATAPDEQLTSHLMSNDLERLLEDLPSQEAELLRLRYGINQEAPMTLSAVARSMGVTRDTARGIERRAVAAVRERSNRVFDYLVA